LPLLFFADEAGSAHPACPARAAGAVQVVAVCGITKIECIGRTGTTGRKGCLRTVNQPANGIAGAGCNATFYIALFAAGKFLLHDLCF
jgi:hypothetical protein